MLQVTARTDFSQPAAFAARLNAVLGDMSGVRQRVGSIVVDSIRQYMEAGRTPDGPIASTGLRYARLMGKGTNRPLIWTGELLRSIHYRLRLNGVQVGSDLDYAADVLAGRSVRIRYAREERDGRWVEGGTVFRDPSSFAGLPSGFRAYTTRLKARNVFYVTDDDVAELVSWIEREVIA